MNTICHTAVASEYVSLQLEMMVSNPNQDFTGKLTVLLAGIDCLHHLNMIISMKRETGDAPDFYFKRWNTWHLMQLLDSNNYNNTAGPPTLPVLITILWACLNRKSSNHGCPPGDALLRRCT